MVVVTTLEIFAPVNSCVEIPQKPPAGYRALAVEDDDHLYQVQRYIKRNTLRAEMVTADTKTVVIGLQCFMHPVYRKSHVAASVDNNVENFARRVRMPGMAHGEDEAIAR